MKRLAALIISFLAATMVLSVARPVLAFDPVENACNGNTTSTVCTTKQTENPLTGKNGVITKATNLISLVVGTAAVFAIVISGFRFIISQGDPAALSSAKNTIVYSVIGLVVVVAAQTIVVFVLNEL